MNSLPRNISFTVLLLSIIAVFIPAEAVWGQMFGQNKVQYKRLEWNYIQTEHFDIYYVDGGLSIAEFTAKEAEKAYRFLSDAFRWNLSENERISIITYKSHNEFEQTNVLYGEVDEGTQGFTEFLKNRVVIPFQGSWEDYRHTVHHELTHAVSLYMLYGSGMMSIIQGLSRTRIPLWFIEGLAEYESLFGMDTESEMYIRDLVVNGRLPDIDQLDYYGYVGVYKCGQSVLHFIVETYGEEKIGELLHHLRDSRDTGRGFKKTLGLDWKELNRRWQKFVNKYHWPVGAVTEQPLDFAEKITDHKEEEYNYYDISPAISPRGDMLVYISNRSDYFDVYLYSLVEGKRVKKLISGERSKAFEELHIIRPGISWSPDEKYIVIASKAGGQDALSIVKVPSGEIERTLKFDLNGIFSPAWSPAGDEIAFVGFKDGVCDIYSVNLTSGALSKVTDDVFSDLSPSWSSSGDFLVFTSDRGDMLDPDYLPYDFDIFDFDYKNYDIYIASHAENWKLSRISDTPDIEMTPIFASDTVIIYTSDANGIFNMYVGNLKTNEHYPITNIVTGCLQPAISGDGEKLAFVALYNFGYDIYLMTDPMNPSHREELQLTPLKKELNSRAPIEVPAHYKGSYTLPQLGSEERPYRKFIFDFRKRDVSDYEDIQVTDTTSFKTESGEYVVKKYKVKFTTDYVFASAYFSSVWGARGVAMAQFSDIMGNHNLFFLTDLQNQVDISNYLFGYKYLPWRMDFSYSMYHFVYYFRSSSYSAWPYGYIYYRDRYYGMSASASYPLSKFVRFELNSDFVAIDRDSLDNYYDEYKSYKQRRLLVSELAYVKDTSIGRYFGPMNGSRIRLSLLLSPNLYPSQSPSSKKRGVDFYSVIADWRKYAKVGFDYSFAFRFSAGASFGDNPQRFFVGGVSNWINRPYYIDIEESDIEDIYISQFVQPVRGGDLYEKIGERYFLTNVEFRFPFIQYLIFGWPIPYPFINVRGALFSDFGAAWYDKFQLTEEYQGSTRLKDAVWGFGLGIRFPFPFIGWPTKWDVAWKCDLKTVYKPRYYLSLGYEF